MEKKNIAINGRTGRYLLMLFSTTNPADGFNNPTFSFDTTEELKADFENLSKFSKYKKAQLVDLEERTFFEVDIEALFAEENQRLMSEIYSIFFGGIGKTAGSEDAWKTADAFSEKK